MKICLNCEWREGNRCRYKKEGINTRWTCENWNLEPQPISEAQREALDPDLEYIPEGQMEYYIDSGKLIDNVRKWLKRRENELLDMRKGFDIEYIRYTQLTSNLSENEKFRNEFNGLIRAKKNVIGVEKENLEQILRIWLSLLNRLVTYDSCDKNDWDNYNKFGMKYLSQEEHND